MASANLQPMVSHERINMVITITIITVAAGIVAEELILTLIDITNLTIITAWQKGPFAVEAETGVVVLHPIILSSDQQ